MDSCFIFGAGKDSWYAAGAGGPVIAADGGYLACQRAGIVPDLLLGDFDSLEKPDFGNILRCRWRRTTRTPFWPPNTAWNGVPHLPHLWRHRRAAGSHPGQPAAAGVAQPAGARGYLYDETFTYTAITNGAIHPRGRSGACCPCSAWEDAKGVYERGVQYPLRTLSSPPVSPGGQQPYHRPPGPHLCPGGLPGHRLGAVSR